MNTKTLTRLTAAFAAVGLLASASPSTAFRMIQVSGTGRMTGGAAVSCDDYQGFAHWNNVTVSWYHNTNLQGAGKTSALQAAMNSWNGVTGASHVAFYVGTTTDGFVTDGRNTMVWESGGSCTGSCLGLTALVVSSGQVIVESDVTFNNDVPWNTNGSDYDTQTVATHELGHTFGIHHTEVATSPQPTMYATYFGTNGRSLESDDQQALQCSEQWYVSPVWEGAHESTNCQSIKGWVWNTKRPNSSLLAQIRNGATPLATTPAFECRADLAGKGNGCHGWSIQTAVSALSPLRDGQYHTVNVANYRTGDLLSGTGQSIICQVGIFRNQTPAEFNDTLGTSWSVGNVFNSSMNGRVTHLRYYKAAEESGVHTLKLWTNSGTFLGSVDVNFGSPGFAGWMTGQLSWPGISIQAGTSYLVTVTTFTKQSKTSCGFSSPITNGPITATGGRWVEGNGIFPTNSSCSNFWTDVYFDQ